MVERGFDGFIEKNSRFGCIGWVEVGMGKILLMAFVRCFDSWI